MLIDARKVDTSNVITADVCIIGGGAAGITLALELADQRFTVILLESGGERPDPTTQHLYAGKNIGLAHEPPETSRSRYLGGSTNCWGGWCRPLDALDFEERPWIANSGWPITKEDLLPYYIRSHDWLQLSEFHYEIDHWSEEIQRLKAAIFSIEASGLCNIVDQLSPPTRFGKLYRSRLEKACNIKTFLFANVTEILTNSNATHATGVVVRTVNGKSFVINARTIVLAAGGIETARLLLLSNKVQTEGLGNAHDLVGRYYMDHPRILSTRVKIPDARRYRPLYDATLHRIHRGVGSKRMRLEIHLAPGPDVQRGMKLPNSRTYLVARHDNDVSKSYLALKALQNALLGRKQFSYPYSKIVPDVMRQLSILLRYTPMTLATIGEVFLNSFLATQEFSLESVLEPIPNPDSRVMLGPERDFFGQNQVEIDWRLTEQDKLHFIALNKLIVDRLSKTGLVIPLESGLPYFEAWPENVVGCWHHMGTTRMHTDPAKGVVDKDCKVHGIHNLFIVGSSVFPTVGSDSPTITLVSLALRLAEKIRKDF